jgi:hypothetical protein
MSIRFKLSPELSDGQHDTIVTDVKGLLEAIKAWADVFVKETPGESFEVETVEMSDEEVNALPEI